MNQRILDKAVVKVLVIDFTDNAKFAKCGNKTFKIAKRYVRPTLDGHLLESDDRDSGFELCEQIEL